MIKPSFARKAIAVFATTGILGFSITGIANALWSDSEKLSLNLTQPWVEGRVIVGDTVHEIFDEDKTEGIYNPTYHHHLTVGAQVPLFDDRDYETLANTGKLAKPLTIELKTHGRIGLNSLQGSLDTEPAYDNEGGFTYMKLPGPLLSEVRPGDFGFMSVKSPEECSTDLLDAPFRLTVRDRLHHAGWGSAAAAGWSASNIGVGMDDTRAEHFCVLVRLKVSDGQKGSHENTVTATGDSEITGEKTTNTDTWNAQIEPVKIDYSREMEEQKEVPSPRYYFSIWSTGQGYIFNNGEFNYRDHIK